MWHEIGDYSEVDYKLPTISGPGNTVWRFSVDAVPGKTFPPFMNLNQQTLSLEFKPDKDEYSDNTYYWMLTVEDVAHPTLFFRSLEMQITVLPPVHLGYEVVITDGAAGSG